GVDVFFVISGFLITGLIVREIESTGRLSLSRFYARRARRLLPATALVFVFVAVMTVAVLPVTRWDTIAQDLRAASLYVINWTLAARSVDYLSQGTAASPLQHFWSLAVEEQFYVIWPLLIVALVWALRRARGTTGVTRAHLATGLLAITVPSLLWSWHLTGTDPGRAYFVTTTRLWELGIGALLAVGATQIARIPALARTLAGWLGLAAIALAAWKFTAATPFPGTAALVPTLGAAAVLAAGLGTSKGLLVLRIPAMRDIGTLSYSLYLWHWPLLVGATAIWGDETGHLWVPTALLVVGFSAVPAWLAYSLVEKPLHHNRFLAATPWRAALVALLCIGLGLGSATAVQRSVEQPTSAASGAARGAEALGEDPTSSPAGIPVDSVPAFLPAPQDASGDNADVYGDGCHQDQKDDKALSCTYGDPQSDRVIALVGDSHAAQWQPALRLLAEENGWRLDTYTKSACLFADVDVWLSSQNGTYTSCRSWGTNVDKALAANPPDVVLVSESGGYAVSRDGIKVPRPEADPILAAGLGRTWSQLRSQGSKVVVLMDTPWVGIEIPDCVALNPDALTTCAASRSEAVDKSARSFQELALDKSPDAGTIDLLDYVCPQSRCAPVIGDVLVYRDSHHLTATYSKSLASAVGERLAAAGIK
ncbi:acyltransferase family protein, partial [Cellulomonas sp. URHD0024]|uniref:acyltransferase family protein n=1 Tax=Cellulomonas sp. URHD0024 TaxID=1302620 RepID=UPI000555C874